MEIIKKGSHIIVTLTETEADLVYRAFSSLNRSVFSGLTADERELFFNISHRLLEVKTGKRLTPGRR